MKTGTITHEEGSSPGKKQIDAKKPESQVSTHESSSQLHFKT